MSDFEDLFRSGVLVEPLEGATPPPSDLWAGKKNGLVVVECPQRIPCDPCHTSCPTGAILPFADINDRPKVDHQVCTGCAICVAACPGLACFVFDLTHGPDTAVAKLPYEMLPVPEKGEIVHLLNRVGEVVGKGPVVRVTQPLKDKTRVVHVVVPKDRVMDIRAIACARPR